MKSTRLVMFCVLSVLGGTTSVVMEESASSSVSGSSSPSSSHSSPRLIMSPLVEGKRAYTYRSNYKRLPSYEFGLGKRWAPNYEEKKKQPFSFGLGKRTRQFSFGLGKRSSYDGLGLYETYAQQDALENYLQGKRASGFNFGLGKRDAQLSADDPREEKLPIKHQRDKLYGFGLGKRFYELEDDRDELDEDAA